VLIENYLETLKLIINFIFLPELRLVTNFGYDRDEGYSKNFTPATARTSPVRQNVLIGNNSYSDGESTNKLLDSYLVYNKTIDDITFDITGGYSYQIFEGNGFYNKKPKQCG
jgi:TonB-dependent starch-binding outer membrane protein SusC